MKKGKFLILALIALVLAGGLALASCRSGCEGNGACKSDDKGKGTFCTTSGCAATTGVFTEKAKDCDC